MCVGKFQRTSVKNHSSLFGATSFLVILASPRQEFAPARASAVVSLELSLSTKKVKKRLLPKKVATRFTDKKSRWRIKSKKPLPKVKRPAIFYLFAAALSFFLPIICLGAFRTKTVRFFPAHGRDFPQFFLALGADPLDHLFFGLGGFFCFLGFFVPRMLGRPGKILFSDFHFFLLW